MYLGPALQGLELTKICWARKSSNKSIAKKNVRQSFETLEISLEIGVHSSVEICLLHINEALYLGAVAALTIL